MGVLQKMEAIGDRDQLRREGQILRGQFLDNFARLESSVHAFGLLLGLKLSPTAPFSQSLRMLRSAREQFRHPKKLDERLDEISEINVIRADIVHSVLEVVTVWDGKVESSLLQFRNVGTEFGCPRQMEPDALAKLTYRIAVMTHQFSQQRLKAPTPAAS